MKFNTSYCPGPSLAEKECPREIPDFILNKSTGKLESAGIIPIYERIQSHHESTTLSYKLKRFAMGDALALGTPRDCNIDITGAPNNLQDVLNLRAKIQDEFSELPADVRDCFANSFESFYSAVIDGSAERRLADYSAAKRQAASSPGGTEPPPAG